MTSKIIIDAENAVLGRLASYVAKQVLLGKEAVIINSEKAIVTGKEEDILKKYRKRRARGGSSQRGPYFPSQPEKILKRTIKNMLPYKQGRGRDAYKRVRCFIGVPEKFQDVGKIKSSGKRRGITLDRISKMLRGGK
jgi:large subunit ribosomal protein L13